MRSLIHELPYERPLAFGELRYQRDGVPTGAVEYWQLTTAVDGYRFLRVDLDARAAASGESTLYHLTLSPEGRPERLRFYMFRQGRDVNGHVLFDHDLVTVSRHVNKSKIEEETTVLPGYTFWFPSSFGLGLLAPFAGEVAATAVPAVTLNREADFCLWPLTAYLTRGQAEQLVMGRQTVMAWPLTIRWQEHERIIWLDEQGLVVQMKRENGLTAVEAHLIRYPGIMYGTR
jgi:hypothetical protein